MSEATYRVVLTHKPEDGAAVCWTASVYNESECAEDYNGPPEAIYRGWGGTREDAFENAQAWCKAMASEPQAPSTHFLSEDGELLDRFEVQA